MRRLLVALALVALFATSAVAHPRDRDSRYLFLNEVQGNITYVDSKSLKVIPNSGGIVSYFAIFQFTSNSTGLLYNDIKKYYPGYTPAFTFSNIVLNCTNADFKVLKMTITGIAKGSDKPKVLFEHESKFEDVSWASVPNGLSDRAKEIICQPALGTAQ